MISVIKRVFCLGPRSCSMKTSTSRVHQDKGVTYLFTESRSPRRRGSRFWHFMQLLAVIRQASSMVWARHRHGKSSKMHLISWNTLEKKAKSVLTFLPKLKPLYANSTIREHKRWKSIKKEQQRFANPRKILTPYLRLKMH